jgi:hypothetical protein
MTCITNRTNMVMQCRTSSFGTRKSLGTMLLLVFGFQVLLSGMVDIASLNAAETVTASGSSPMKSHNGQGSRTEGFVAISGAEPILKSGKESGGSKIGNKPRRLIRKSLAEGPQPESPQQADQGRPSSMPVAGDQATPPTTDSLAGMAKSAAGMSPVTPPISSGNSIFTRSPGMSASSAIARGGRGIVWFINGRCRVWWIVLKRGKKRAESDQAVARVAAAPHSPPCHVGSSA